MVQRQEQRYDFDNISEDQDYWGTVASVDDPTKSGKIKVRIANIFGDDLDIKLLPYAIPRFLHTAELLLPPIGSIVQIKFRHNNVQFPEWWIQPGRTGSDMSDNDYPSGVILLQRDLSDYGLEGQVRVQYSESEGLTSRLIKNNKTSEIIIRPDGSIYQFNGVSGQVVHLAKDGISLGSENKSAEPAVLGTQNKTALTQLNDNIQTIVNDMLDFYDKLKTVCQNSPYTAPLVPVIVAAKLKLQQDETQLHQDNSTQIDKTPSSKVNLD